MTVTTRTARLVDGQEMSWEDYVALGTEPRAEYVDGRLLVSPSPSRPHQQTIHRLVSALEAVLPDDLDVTSEWSWKVGDDEFIPDVVVHALTDETVRFTGTPVLAIEVLSSNRSADLVTKVVRYAAAGLSHYWVVDLRDGVLDAFELHEGTYRPTAHVTLDAPADVSFGPASVRVDLAALTATRAPRR